jgi:hypothetical protein
VSLILKNNTVSSVPVSDLDIVVPGSGTYNITNLPVAVIRRSNNLILLLSNGTLTLNDGILDLDTITAVSVIYGSIREIKAAVINDALVSQSELWSSDKVDSLIDESRTGHIHHHSYIVDDEPEKHFLINDSTATTTSVYSSNKVDTIALAKAGAVHTHLETDITDLKSYALSTIQVIPGNGLQGGGYLSSNVNLSIKHSDIDHTLISNIGINSHTTIDSHIADNTKHRQINDSSSANDILWSGSKITNELLLKSNTTHDHNSVYVPLTRTVSTGTGLLGGGALSGNLTLTVKTSDLLHGDLQNSGTNSHATIDSHIADNTKHRQINDLGNSTTELWSSSQVISQLSLKQNSLGYTAENVANKGAAGGYAPLDSNSFIPTQYIPATAILDTYPANSQVEQLALTIQKGDVCVRTDIATTYIALNGNNASMSDWQQLLFPAPVTSVSGKTGAVTLNKTDVGLSNVANSLQFAVSNYLSEGVGQEATIRSNIGAAASSDLTTHINTNGAHGSSSALWNANQIQSKAVFDSSIGDGKILTFVLANNRIEYKDAPVTSVSGKTGAVTLNKTDVGLSNVANSLQFAVSNYLSEGVGQEATIRSNIGAAASSDLTTHVNTNGAHGSSSALWNANQIQGVTVDDVDISNKRGLVYNAVSGNLEYEDVLLAVDNTINAVQVRRVNVISYNNAAGFNLLVWEAVDYNNGFSQNVGDYSQVICNNTGNYIITYDVNTGLTNTGYQQRLRLNGSTVLNGSFTRGNSASTSRCEAVTCSVIVSLTAGDYIQLQIRSESTTSVQVQTATLKIVKLHGVQGLQGPQGIAGAGISTVNALIDQNTMNFSNSFTVSSGGAGIANVSLNAANIGGSVSEFSFGVNGVATTSSVATLINRTYYAGTSNTLVPTICTIIAAVGTTPSEACYFTLMDGATTLCTITIPAGTTANTPTIFTGSITGLATGPSILTMYSRSTSTRSITTYYFSIR